MLLYYTPCIVIHHNTGVMYWLFCVGSNVCIKWTFSDSHAYDSFICRCAAAYVLLAEEEATTITEAERLFKQALKSGMKLSHCHAYIASIL